MGLNESRVWLGGHLSSAGTCPVKCHTLVSSNICSSSVYSSPVFCEAQMETNRRFCLFSRFRGIVIDMSVVHRWQTRTDILIDSPWWLFEGCRSVGVKRFRSPVSACWYKWENLLYFKIRFYWEKWQGKLTTHIPNLSGSAHHKFSNILKCVVVCRRWWRQICWRHVVNSCAWMCVHSEIAVSFTILF